MRDMSALQDSTLRFGHYTVTNHQTPDIKVRIANVTQSSTVLEWMLLYHADNDERT